MSQIEYELAKELKDAGFPKSQLWKEAPNGDEFVFVDDDSRAVPTLSELIEACGKKVDGKFFRLEANPHSWTAEYVRFGMCQFTFQMPTPEEAVARLYLALNKK